MLDEVVEHAALPSWSGEQGLAATDTREVDDAVVAAVGHDAMGISVAGRPRRARRLRRCAVAAAVEAAARRGAAQPDPGGGAAPRGRRRPHGAARAAGARRDGLRRPGPARRRPRPRGQPPRRRARPGRPAARGLRAGRRARRRRGRGRAVVRGRGAAHRRAAGHRPAGRRAVAARRALEPLAVDRHRPRTMWMVSLLDAGAHAGPRRHRRGRRRRARRPAPRPGARAARRRRRLRGAPAGAPPARPAPCPRSRACPPARPPCTRWSRRGRPPPRWTPRSADDLDQAASAPRRLAPQARGARGPALRPARPLPRRLRGLRAGRRPDRRGRPPGPAARPRRGGRRGHRLGHLRPAGALPGPRRRRRSATGRRPAGSSARPRPSPTASAGRPGPTPPRGFVRYVQAGARGVRRGVPPSRRTPVRSACSRRPDVPPSSGRDGIAARGPGLRSGGVRRDRHRIALPPAADPARDAEQTPVPLSPTFRRDGGVARAERSPDRTNSCSVRPATPTRPWVQDVRSAASDRRRSGTLREPSMATQS